MKEIKFTYVYGTKKEEEMNNINLLNKPCPFKMPAFVFSESCLFCINYCGRVKGRQSILCNRDEEASPESFNKIMLVELKNPTY